MFFLSPFSPQGLPFFVLALTTSTYLSPGQRSPGRQPSPGRPAPRGGQPARIVLEARGQPSCLGRDELAVGVNAEVDCRSADSSQAAAVCPHFTAALIFDTSQQRGYRRQRRKMECSPESWATYKRALNFYSGRFTPQRKEIDEREHSFFHLKK